jgi:prevent-host-death family protein
VKELCTLDHRRAPAPTEVTAEEAATGFSELIARAEQGESFVVTKDGKPVARIEPTVSPKFDRERARKAAENLRASLASQGPPVSEEEAQRNWGELKESIEHDRQERMDRWLKS